jgi:hypothetical protein
MTQRIPENFSAAEWRLVTIMGNTMPPRDPNDDDDDDEEDDNDTEPERRAPTADRQRTRRRRISAKPHATARQPLP